LGVLALKVGLEFRAVAQRLPVVRVGLVPGGGGGDCLSRCVLWFPAERAQFVDVDAVSPVVSGPVGDEADQVAWFVNGFENRFDHFEVADRGPGSDVVDLAGLAVLEDHEGSGDMVVHVCVIADLLAIAVDGQGLVQQCAGGEQRHGLLEVLVGSDVVAASGDGYGQVVGHEVRQGQVVAGGFAGAVWAAWAQVVGFEAVVVAVDGAVDFIGADLVVAQFVFAGHLEQDVRAGDVGLREDEWVQDALVHVRFGGEVDDRVDLVGVPVILHGVADQFEVADVADDHLQVWVFEVSVQVVLAGSVGHFVQNRDPNARAVLEDVSHEVAADEAAAACDEDVFVFGHGFPSCLEVTHP
jgi:hypothetical protein